MKKRTLYNVLTGKKNKVGGIPIYIGGTEKVREGYCTVSPLLLDSLIQYGFCKEDDKEFNRYILTDDKGKKFVDEYSIYGLDHFPNKRLNREERQIEWEIEQMPDPDE